MPERVEEDELVEVLLDDAREVVAVMVSVLLASVMVELPVAEMEVEKSDVAELELVVEAPLLVVADRVVVAVELSVIVVLLEAVDSEAAEVDDVTVVLAVKERLETEVVDEAVTVDCAKAGAVEVEVVKVDVTDVEVPSLDVVDAEVVNDDVMDVYVLDEVEVSEEEEEEEVMEVVDV